MNVIIAQNTDAKRWDQYVSQQPLASPYQYYAWKLATESAYRQYGHYLMALNDNDHVCGVLPLIVLKRPFGNTTLCSLPYCDHGEALADNEEVKNQLITRANDLRKSLSAAPYEYRASKTFDPKISINNLADTGKVRMLLPLPYTSTELLASFKTKLRSQIKKAKKNGLIFEIGNNKALLDDFYQVFTINMKALGSPTHSYSWFQSISRYYADNCVISIVRYNETPVGAGLILTNTNTAAIPWASTDRKYNKLAPNMLLYWSLLKYATDHGCNFFDFGRSTPGEGTFKFKQQWGSIPVALDWITYPKSVKTNPSTTKKNSPRETAKNIWRHLPLPLTVMIGSRIRKYISL